MIKVNILDLNDNVPEFKPLNYKAKIRSRFPVNTINVVTVFAEDPDSDLAGRVTFALEQDANGQFGIKAETGDIFLARPLAGPEKSFHLVVSAKDGQGLEASRQAKVHIVVDDDDITFDMPQFKFKVSENVSPYSSIGQLKAQIFSSSFEMEVIDSNVEGSISIDSSDGLLRTESRLDFETHPLIVLNIELNDAITSVQSYCQVIIEVEDVNDNAPEFGSSSAVASIKEDFVPGDVVYHSKASDADKGANGQVTYRLVQNDEDAFAIESDTGNLILRQTLDFERKSDYEVVIEASDMGIPKLTSSLKLHINVHDVNDNIPIFEKSLYQVDLSETHQVNSPIATVTATDKDSGRNGRISFSISDNPYIAILKNSGVLVLKQPLDREFSQSLELQLTASDLGIPPLSSSATLKLSISDKNDNSPVFDQRSYSFRVQENEPKGTVVGQVNAIDNDEGVNGEVRYSFKTDVSGFEIASTTGVIVTTQPHDRETTQVYEVRVEATDQGQPRRSAEAVVKIQVLDVNDNAPVLLEPAERLFYVPDGAPAGTVVGRLIAEDPDKPEAVVVFEATGNFENRQ